MSADQTTEGADCVTLALRGARASPLPSLNERALIAQALEIERLRALLRRYRTETPLGHQPHMIAAEVDAVLWNAAKARCPTGAQTP